MLDDDCNDALTLAPGKILIQDPDGATHSLNADVPEGLRTVGALWTRATWSNGLYHLSWLGRPIRQLPEDIIMMQEVFWEVRPDIVVETGVADGGSAVFWASMLAVTGGRAVVSVDLRIPDSVRRGVDAHPVGQFVKLIEGDSADPDIVARVRAIIRPSDRVLVILDSDHSESHVMDELDSYAGLVTPGSYVIVTDGVMETLAETPNGLREWKGDNPLSATDKWLPLHPEFSRDRSRERLAATYFPGGWLRRDGQAITDERPTGDGVAFLLLWDGGHWRKEAERECAGRLEAQYERDVARGRLSSLLESKTWSVGRALVGPAGKLKRRLSGHPPATDPRRQLLPGRHKRPSLTAASRRHLSLLKEVLTDSIRGDSYRPYLPDRGSNEHRAWDELRRGLPEGVEMVRRTSFDRERRTVGGDWPFQGETMVGLRRPDNLQTCIETVHEEAIPGDLVETGVWRGGACILMRAVLAELGDTTRIIWACDSFEGLPEPDVDEYPQDEGDTHWKRAELAVSVDIVRANFERFGLLDNQVRFVEGWFEDTLPILGASEIAVLRLDGDMYGSTKVALESLEPRVPEGGFVIVDDYGAIAQCRQAVLDYRAERGIDDPINTIDWTGAYWRKSRSTRAHTAVDRR